MYSLAEHNCLEGSPKLSFPSCILFPVVSDLILTYQTFEVSQKIFGFELSMLSQLAVVPGFREGSPARYPYVWEISQIREEDLVGEMVKTTIKLSMAWWRMTVIPSVETWRQDGPEQYIPLHSKSRYIKINELTMMSSESSRR